MPLMRRIVAAVVVVAVKCINIVNWSTLVFRRHSSFYATHLLWRKYVCMLILNGFKCTMTLPLTTALIRTDAWTALDWRQQQQQQQHHQWIKSEAWRAVHTREKKASESIICRRVADCARNGNHSLHVRKVVCSAGTYNSLSTLQFCTRSMFEEKEWCSNSNVEKTEANKQASNKNTRAHTIQIHVYGSRSSGINVRAQRVETQLKSFSSSNTHEHMHQQQ